MFEVIDDLVIKNQEDYRKAYEDVPSSGAIMPSTPERKILPYENALQQ